MPSLPTQHSISLWLNQFLPSTIAGDISFWLLFIGASIGLGVYLGRSLLVNLVLYGYIALALLRSLPVTVFSFSLPYGKVIVFGGILCLLMLMGRHLFDIHISNAGSDFFWRILVMGFLVTGMTASIVLSVLPKKEVLAYMSLASYQVFVDQWSFVVWLVLPLLFLWIVNKRLN